MVSHVCVVVANELIALATHIISQSPSTLTLMNTASTNVPRTFDVSGRSGCVPLAPGFASSVACTASCLAPLATRRPAVAGGPRAAPSGRPGSGLHRRHHGRGRQGRADARRAGGSHVRRSCCPGAPPGGTARSHRPTLRRCSTLTSGTSLPLEPDFPTTRRHSAR